MPSRSYEGASFADARRGSRHVFVRELELVGSIGVHEREKRYEQRVVISVDLAVQDDYDGASDRLEDVVDYGAIVRTIKRIVEQEHVNLLETLAERIAQSCLVDRRVLSVRVRIEKPDAVDACRSVGIAIERLQPA